jgi:hypothetical protein
MALNRHCEPRSGEAIFIHPQYSLINAEIASSAYGLLAMTTPNEVL